MTVLVHFAQEGVRLLDAREIPRLRPFRVLGHVGQPDAASVQLREDELDARMQLCLRVQTRRDDDPILPVRLTAAIDRAIAVRRVRDVGDAHVTQCGADLRHRRSAGDDLAGLGVDATVAVEDQEFGAAEVLVRALWGDEIAATDVIGAVLAALLRRAEASSKLLEGVVLHGERNVGAATHSKGELHFVLTDIFWY